MGVPGLCSDAGSFTLKDLENEWLYPVSVLSVLPGLTAHFKPDLVNIMIRKVCWQEGSGEQHGRSHESWLQGLGRSAPGLGHSAPEKPGHLSLMGS